MYFDLSGPWGLLHIQSLLYCICICILICQDLEDFYTSNCGQINGYITALDVAHYLRQAVRIDSRFFTFFSLCSDLNKNLPGNLFPFKLVCLPLIWRKHTWSKICPRAKINYFLFIINCYSLILISGLIWTKTYQVETMCKSYFQSTSVTKTGGAVAMNTFVQVWFFFTFLINSPSNPWSRVEGGCNFQLQEISHEWDGRSREESSVEAGPLSVQVTTLCL